MSPFALFTTFGQDLRYGIRTLLRERAFSLTTVVTLALGIGANTAMFGLIDAILFRPFPVRDPGRLAVLYGRSTLDGSLTSTSYLDYLDLQGHAEFFSSSMAYVRWSVSFNAGGRTERLRAEGVTESYFGSLGVGMVLGHDFENSAHASPRVVIGHGLWTRVFGGDPGVIGRQVRVSGRACTIIGVAPRGFQGVTLDWGLPPELWFPLEGDAVSPWGSRKILEERGARAFLVLVRLKPGVRIEQAEAALQTRARQLELAYPDTNRGASVTLLSAAEARFWPPLRRRIVLFLAVLASTVALVLVIACANVANLLLARAARREREIAVRLAIGASRIRIVRQLLTESLVLALGGLGGGVVLAAALIRLLEKFPLAFEVPLALELGMDHRVLAFSGAIALVTTLGFGLLPALSAARADLRGALNERSPTSGARIRGLLLVVQVALSIVLLVGAGLFVRTLRKAAEIPTGWRPERILLLAVELYASDTPYDQERGLGFYREVLGRVTRMPGVHSASWAGDMPLARRQLTMRFTLNERPAERDEDWIPAVGNVVAPRYFETLGIPLVRGREFADSDRLGAPGVAVVNEAMARRHWPGVDPVGKRITVWRRPDLTRSPEQYEIVGVAGNVRQRTLWDESGPYLYLPLWQRYSPEMRLHVHTAGEPLTILPRVREAIAAVDPDLPVLDPRTLVDQVKAALSQQRLAAALLSASGMLALVLSVIGVYGLTAYSVAQRSREFGVRIALGASASNIVKLVLRGSLVRVGAGIVLGFAIALTLARFVEGYLYGIAPFDPVTFVGIGLVLLASGVVASLLPSVAILRIDAVSSLRQE